MGGGIAHAPDEVHPLPEVLSHDLPELPGVYQVHQGILPGLDQRAVHRVHPLHRALHRPPAVEDAGGQVDGQNALRRHRGGDEGGELGIGEEAVEVGHGNHPKIIYMK